MPWINYLPSIFKKSLHGKYEVQQAIKNSGWLFIDKALRVILALTLGVWMARALGPEKFGLLSYVFAFCALFIPVAGFCVDNLVVRNLVRSSAESSVILGSAANLRLIAGVLAIAICNGTIFLLEPNDSFIRILTFVVSLSFLCQPFDVIDFWFQSQTSSKYSVLAKLPSLLVASVARMALIISASPLIMYAWVQTAEIVLVMVGLLTVYICTGESINTWRPNCKYTLSLLKESWPLVFAGLSVMLYMKIDVVMLAKMVGDHAAGIYSAATRISEGLYFIPMIILSSFAPILVAARERGTKNYRNTFFKLYLLMARLSLFLAILLSFIAAWLVNILFGDAYREVVPILQVHVWASVAVFLGVASSHFLIIEGHQKMALCRAVLGLIANIILNYFLIPRYAALGAAIATLISYFLVNFFVGMNQNCIAQTKLMISALNPLSILGMKKHIDAL